VLKAEEKVQNGRGRGWWKGKTGLCKYDNIV